MKAVFLDRGTFPEHIRVKTPRRVDDWTEYEQTNADQVLNRCQNAEIVLTNKVILSDEILRNCPRLSLICVTATGMNNVNLKSCEELGITVVNATDYGTQSVAEHVLMFMLNLIRRFPLYASANETKAWSRSPFFCDIRAPMQTLKGRTLSIVGRGTLGTAVGNLAESFGMDVIYSERPNAHSVRENYVSFSEAMARANFVSLHCPLTDETHHLLNEHTLSLLKPTAFVVNAGRGPLIDEQALLDVLKSKKIAGAALDVTTHEPPKESDLIWQIAQQSNTIVTPHIAWAADEALQTLIDQIVEKIEAFLLTHQTSDPS